MICNSCGKEFGSGVSCQHCGIDRVEGLGSFVGLHPNSDDILSKNGGKTPGGISVTGGGNVMCFSCGEIIPKDARFCPYCRKEQIVICPSCGFRYSAKFPNCYKCGTNREQFMSGKEIVRKPQEHIRLEEEEEFLRKKQEEAERLQILMVERERIEAQKRIDAEVRKQKETESAELQNNEIVWFSNYISQHKSELLEKQKQIKRDNEVPKLPYLITLAISVLATAASCSLLGTELWGVFLLCVILGFIACIIAGVSMNRAEKKSIDSFLFEEYY